MFGSGEFEFQEWTTPFTNSGVEILEVAYAPKRASSTDAFPHDVNTLMRENDSNDLVARIYVYDSGNIYRLVFPQIRGMRLLDEGGLLEFWEKTSELGGRPGRTTFRVRNHAWTRESVVSFLESDGWSFVIASDNECLEVLSATAPIITQE